MDESATRWRLPWLALLTLGLLVVVLLLTLLRLPAEAAAVVPWRVLAVLATFCLLRWQQGYLGGVVAALLLALHPVFTQGMAPFPLALRGTSLELVVLAGVTLGCRLTFQQAFAWRSWLATAAVLILASALAWPAWPLAGLGAGLVTFFGLLGTAFLAARRSRKEPNAPALGNVLAAVGVALVVAVAALFLAPVSAALTSAAPWHLPLATGVDLETISAGQLLSQATSADDPHLGLRGFQAEDLNQWAWPRAWVVGPLALWGLWCGFRRGWKESHRHQAPLAWVLLLFVLIELACVALHPQTAAQTQFLPLATLAVLLTVFGVADVVRSITDGLVLLPPQERHG